MPPSPPAETTAVPAWQGRVLRFLDSGHEFSATERALSYKHRFVNTVFIVAGLIVSLFGIWRIAAGENLVVGILDVLFGIAAGILVVALRKSDRTAIEPVGNVVLAVSLLLFSTVYVLIPDAVRSGPFLLITASAFFLKGSRNGLRWTLLCVAVMLLVELLPMPYAKGWYGTLTSLIDIACLSMLLSLYEMQKNLDAQDLRNNEEVFRGIFNSVNDAIFLIDQGRFAQWNTAAPELFRCPGDDFIGHGLRDLLAEQNPVELVDSLAAAENEAAHKKSPPFELLLQRQSGGDFYANLRLTPVTIGGRPLVQAIVRDIDARKRSEIELARYRDELEQRVRERTRRLEESELRFARLLELTAEGIFLHDHGSIVDATNAFCRLTGYVKNELIGQDFIPLLVHPEDRQRVANHIAAESTQSYELRILRHDGTTIEVESFGRSVDFENRSLRAGVWRDITANKEIERNLRRSQEAAEETTRAKSAFIANMSHEIRTPLNAIIGITHRLQREAAHATQRERLERVSGAARHLLLVLTDILDISKIEAGKFVLEERPFRPRQLVDDITNLIRDTAEQKGLAFRVLIDDRVPPVLKGDPVRLSQVLVNLASNSVKFTEVGNVTLWISAIGINDGKATLRFRITDTGIGMTQEQQSRLFRDFEQAESSTTRKYGGTGLGLSISRRLVERMGGQIQVRSNVGQGSEFWFEVALPVSLADPGEPESATSEISAAMISGAHAGARILLVEDTPINQEVACDLLHEAGLLTETAENGKQAVDRLRSEDFDLVLMDLQMPIMDGLSATRLIRQLPGKESLPVIAMTANAYAEDRGRCLEAGMNDYLAKPIEPSLLYAALARWLPRRDPPAKPDDSAQASAPEASAVTTVDASALIATLATTPEFADVATVSLARRKPARYLELLTQFFDEHGEDDKRLRQILGSDTPAARTEALRLAHTLKGLAATFGLSTLITAAKDIHARLDGSATDQDLATDILALETAFAASRQTARQVTGIEK